MSGLYIIDNELKGGEAVRRKKISWKRQMAVLL